MLLCGCERTPREYFAWIEGDQVVTESKFSSGKPGAKGSRYGEKMPPMVLFWRPASRTMPGSGGSMSLTRCVMRPKALSWRSTQERVIRINGRFPLMSLLRPTEPAHPSSRQLLRQHANDSASGKPKKDSAAAGMSEAELEAVFSRVLDKKLAPVYRELALSHDKTPGFRKSWAEWAG